jgi:nuclear transcription Y subunit beta
MKGALPESSKVSREAKELVQEATSEFISFITSESSDKCMRERRKTICGEDILYAMRTLGFEEYIPPLMAYLERYRTLEQSRRNEKQAPGTSEGTDGEDSESDGGGIDDSAKDDTS